MTTAPWLKQLTRYASSAQEASVHRADESDATEPQLKHVAVRSSATSPCKSVVYSLEIDVWRLLTLSAALFIASPAEAQIESQTVTVNGLKMSPCEKIAEDAGPGATTYCSASGSLPADFFGDKWYRYGNGDIRTRSPAPQTNSPNSSCTESPKTNKPVVIATGEKYLDEQDFRDESLAGLSFARQYRSTGAWGLVGSSWTSTYDFAILDTSVECIRMPGYSGQGCLPYWLQITTPDGEKLNYTLGPVPMYFLNGNPNAAPPVNAWTAGQFEVNIGPRTYYYNALTKRLTRIVESGSTWMSFAYGATPIPWRGVPLLTVTSRTGRTVKFTWSGSTVSEVEAPDGRKWKYLYGTNGALSFVESPSGLKRTAYHYEDPSNPLLLTGYSRQQRSSPAGSFAGPRKTRYEYDIERRVVRSAQLDPNGVEEEFDEFSYGPNITTVTNERGQAIEYAFEEAGAKKRLIRTDRLPTDSCGATNRAQTYSPNGQLASVEDFRGGRTEFAYSDAGDLIRETRSAETSQPIRIEHERQPSGTSILTYKRVDGNAYRRRTVTYQGGAMANVPATVTEEDLTPGGRTLISSYSVTYHPNGSQATATAKQSINGSMITVLHEIFDSLGNLTSRVNALGHTETYEQHDALGKPGRIVDANGVATEIQYEESGRISQLSKLLPGGSRITSYRYDDEGRHTGITYPTGNQLDNAHSVSGRLLSAVNGLGETLSVFYDLRNGVSRQTTDRRIATVTNGGITVSDSGSFVLEVQTDSLGRAWKRRYSHGQQSRVVRDGEGSEIEAIGPAGRSWRSTLDSQGRVTEKVDPMGYRTTFAYSSLGQLASITDARAVTTSYTYNGFGWLTGSVSPDSGPKTHNSFDDLGNVLQLTSAGDSVWSFSYDNLGRLTSRTSGTAVESFTYDQGPYSTGKLSRLHDSSGITMYQYGDDGQLTRQVSAMFGQVYTTQRQYDSSGRLGRCARTPCSARTRRR